jgi:isoprenylcysteine carboxyl methyltransferase (ICMT) family protein YpbQ
MPRFAFLAFALVCLLQRLVEIARNDRNVQRRRPKWTAISIILVFAGFGVFSIVEAFLPGHVFYLTSAVAGAALFVAGFLIRRWVLRALGPLWAIDIDLKPDHYLVTTGPYRFCRHPNYVAMLLEMTGFCLIPSAFYTLAVFLPVYVIVLAARIRLEERALIDRLGVQYREYMRTTFALFPIPRQREFSRPRSGESQ